MPIYAYKCASCGHAKDVLRKISDAPLTLCPACGEDAFTKQLTAAGFQLKGSGWYATDFKGGPKAPSGDGEKSADAVKTGDAAKPADGAAKPAETASKPAESSSPVAKPDAPKAAGTSRNSASA